MKKTTLLFVFAFIINIGGYSQSCLPDGILFSTQVEVDSFQINYPNCTVVEGNVEITGDDITNLNGLTALTSIEGDLYIGYCTALPNLTGLDNVTSVGETIRIYMNTALVSLSGLDNIEFTGQNLRITNNDTLSDISALSKIESVGENLRIYMNRNLLNLTGLNNVSNIGDNLRITNNTVLSSLLALSNITSIGGELTIDNNDSLTSLAGVDNIAEETITDLVIRNNFSLSNCEVTSVCNYLGSPNGDISIYNNSANCNSKEEIAALCTSGIHEISNNSFYIYPNPAKNEITISSNEETIISKIIIYNSLGQEMLNENKPNSNIDISNLIQGIYIIEIIVDESKTKKKLIIE